MIATFLLNLILFLAGGLAFWAFFAASGNRNRNQED